MPEEVGKRKELTTGEQFESLCTKKVDLQILTSILCSQVIVPLTLMRLEALVSVRPDVDNGRNGELYCKQGIESTDK